MFHLDDLMKIAVTGTRGIPNIQGGIETLCEELYPHLASKGLDIYVMRRSSYDKSHVNKWRGVNIIDISAPKRKSMEALIHTFKSVWRAYRIHADIIHIHAIGPALAVPFAKLLGLKVVFTHHGADYERDKWGLFAKSILQLGERLGTKYSDEVIAISKGIQCHLTNKYGRKDCHLIKNGAPKPVFTDNPEYFSELGIEKGKYFMAMCRLVPEKKIEHLIEAFSKLQQEGKTNGIKLVVAGAADFEDDYSRLLYKKANECGAILTGFVKGEKLQSLLSGARCFVIPSSHEGLSIALLEAMAYKLPIIASDIPANLEVSLGSTSYYPFGNISILAEKLYQNIQDDYHHVDYDLSCYDWKTISDQVYEIYMHI